MVYHYTSCEPIIAEFLATSKLTDSSYADDLLVWLKQAMNLMRVRNMLTPTTCVIEVHNQIGKLPCGLVHMDGLYYNGFRLRKGTGVIDSRVCKDSHLVENDYQSYFVSDPEDEGYINNSQDYRLIRGLDLKQANGECPTDDYYLPYPNHIQTTFEDGCVILFYRKMSTDKEGYPLVPDEENVRQAIFWWLMGRLTISGYKHPDPKMDYDYCEFKYKQYARAGKNVVKYWSIDQRQAIVDLTINLIPPQGYYDRFFVGGEQTKRVIGV
jgi:hypothetical protein